MYFHCLDKDLLRRRCEKAVLLILKCYRDNGTAQPRLITTYRTLSYYFTRMIQAETTLCTCRGAGYEKKKK